MTKKGAKVRWWTKAEDARLRVSAARRSPSLLALSREFKRSYLSTIKRASRIGARRYQKHVRSPWGPAVETRRECPECGGVFWAKGNRVYCGVPCRELAEAERFKWFLTQPDRDLEAAAEWRAVVVFE